MVLEAPRHRTPRRCVRRLDSVLDEAIAASPKPRILLKLDTQGYDLPAFRGAGNGGRSVLALQSEVACVPIYEGMPRMPEQLSEYESAGFEVSAMSPSPGIARACG